MFKHKFDSDLRFEKDFVKMYEKAKATGEVDLEMVDFDYLPTLRCNLNCRHCRQKDIRSDKDFIEIKEEMSLDQVKMAWDRIPIENLIVKFNGGELFVRPDIFEIMDYFQARGAFLVVATNALIFRKPENIAQIKRYNIVEFTTSIDGWGKTHDRIRSFPGLFNIVINFIKSLSLEFKILIECCVQEDNVKDLPRILKLKKELGAYKIRFQLPVFSTAEEIKENRRVLGEDLDFEVQICDKPEYAFSVVEFLSSYEQMKALNIPFDMHPKFFDRVPELCLGRKARQRYQLLCTYLARAKVDPNGDLRFCPYIIKSFGNIKNGNFRGFWNGEEFRQFRKKVLNNNLLPSCENCPHTRIYKEK